jgi:hypothetical protein
MVRGVQTFLLGLLVAFIIIMVPLYLLGEGYGIRPGRDSPYLEVVIMMMVFGFAGIMAGTVVGGGWRGGLITGVLGYVVAMAIVVLLPGLMFGRPSLPSRVDLGALVPLIPAALGGALGGEIRTRRRRRSSQ